jgi:hypothetical protein
MEGAHVYVDEKSGFRGHWSGYFNRTQQHSDSGEFFTLAGKRQEP